MGFPSRAWELTWVNPKIAPATWPLRTALRRGSARRDANSACTRSSSPKACTVRMLPTASLATLLASSCACAWSPAKPDRNSCCARATPPQGESTERTERQKERADKTLEGKPHSQIFADGCVEDLDNEA